MKKIGIIILIISLFFLTGCEKEEEMIKKEKKEPVKETVEPIYKDENNTPISFYKLQGNTLQKLTQIERTLVVEEDVDDQ